MATEAAEVDGDMSLMLKTLHLLRFVNAAKSKPKRIESVKVSKVSEETVLPPLPKRPTPPPKPTRTPMGDYIIPSGESPLTSLGNPVPGPADYYPKIDLTRKSTPQYSIVSKTTVKACPTLPGPADYGCGGDLTWKGKTITLKGREGVDFSEKSHKTGKFQPGPADYYCGEDLIWKDKTITFKAREVTDVTGQLGMATMDIGPAKYNIGTQYGKRRYIDVMSGPPNAMVQPVDTHGFDTPGPKYRPKSSYWGRGPRKSIGNSRRLVFTDGSNSPGPGDYNIQVPNKGPSYTLAKRLYNPDEYKREKVKNDPAPNTYDVGSTIGKAVSVSLTARREEPSSAGKRGPAPNTYTLKPSLNSSHKAVTMAYRWMDTHSPSYQPGPADYSINHVTLKKSPHFTCRRQCKPTYPDTASLPSKSSPGPGKYNITSCGTGQNNPAFSMRCRTLPTDCPTKKGNCPAPNQYDVVKYPKAGSERAPAFTMGKRFEPPCSKGSPGPAAYNLQGPRSSGPKYTMSKRLNKRVIDSQNPAPNAYKPPSRQNNRGLQSNLGIKLKSRASPYVFSGFRTTRLAEPDS